MNLCGLFQRDKNTSEMQFPTTKVSQAHDGDTRFSKYIC